MAHTLAFRRLVRALQLARRMNLTENKKPLPVHKSQVRLSRRNFIKTGAVAGSTAISSSLFPGLIRQAFASGSEQKVHVAIIGAGLAGLNTAYQLKKAGIEAHVYEASNRLGGRVFSATGLINEGMTMELGAEFINTDHEDMLSLVEDFGLPLFNRPEHAESINAPASAFYFSGVNWPENEIAAMLQALAEQISHDADLLDQDWDHNAPKFDRLSVTDYLDQHTALIPQAFIRTLIENTIRTEFGVEPSESSALQLLFNLPTVDGQQVELLGNSDEVFTVQGGNERIIDGLRDALPGQIHTGMKLEKLEGDKKEGFELTFSNDKKLEADFVVLAMPFSVLRNIKLETKLPKNLHRFINEVDLGRNEKLQAGFKTRAWRQAQGFSMEAWTDLGFSEVWDGSQRETDKSEGMLTFYLGGKEVQEAKNATESGTRFVQRLGAFIPGLESASKNSFKRTHWTRNPFTHGAYVNYRPRQLTRFGEYLWVEADDPADNQSVNVGRLVFAGEHLSDEYYGFMNGAAQTGRLAASHIIQTIATAGSVQKNTGKLKHPV